MSLIFNATFRRKEVDIEPEKCKVTKVVELSESDYNYFSKHLLNNYDFILENRDCMGYEDDVRCCMLVLSENSNDGILVDAQGSAYARYVSFLPEARKIIDINNDISFENLSEDIESDISM